MTAQGRILIIEDNQNIVFVEKLCLEANGYTVNVAADGISGLDKALAEHPDLIILDLILPKLNGYLVLEAMQNNPLTKNIPVLVTSARAQAADVKQAYSYQIAGYLIKPFTHLELLDKVNQIAHRKDEI